MFDIESRFLGGKIKGEISSTTELFWILGV